MDDGLLFTEIEIPEEYLEPERAQLPAEENNTGNCVICNSPHREAVETIACSGRSFKSVAEYVTEHFGLKVSGFQVKRHMVNHVLEEHSMRVVNLLQGARQALKLQGEDASAVTDEELPLVTMEGLIMVLLSEAINAVVRGIVRIRDISDVERVVKMYQNAQRLMHQVDIDNRKLEQEAAGQEASVEEALTQLGYIMQALRNKVPESILEEAVLEAFRLGFKQDFVDITEVPIYKKDYQEPDMTLAIEDAQRLGRKRTRQELEEAEWQPVVVEEADDDDEDLPPDD